MALISLVEHLSEVSEPFQGRRITRLQKPLQVLLAAQTNPFITMNTKEEKNEK
jgi:hypothetical protein